ncbi:aromatic ring-hydroxylating oxygenase subunit alpha [Nocardia fluminea]|uniref:aromatic ring-hydroxylating oxygenase subunit alpha n=1 Tax=Nocardia fluminea TaxID=134984 RepID=UPI0033F99C94
MTHPDKAFADTAGTTINRSIFSDSTTHQRELARVFSRTWLFLAHEGQFRKPGDFFTTYMGADPVIVTRRRDGGYNALLNSCRHRGMRVCRFDEGNAQVFTCPYHGWGYNTDGALVTVPDQDNSYGDSLDTSAWGLRVVPRIETYKGLIFGTWDTEIPSLIDYLGDYTFYLDLMLDPDGQGSDVVPNVHKWRMRGNWKLGAEQFCGDMYHAASTHLSAMIVEAQNSHGIMPPTTGLQVALPNGHGLGGFDAYDYWGASGLSEQTVEWMAGLQDRTEAHLGRARARDAVLIHGTIFPNASLLWPRWNLRVWHPKGPDAMEVYSWCILPRSAPDSVRRDLLLDYQRHFSASGTWEQDDGEQWNYATNSHDGFMTRDLPLNYGMGQGRAANTRFPEFPGVIDEVNSEINQRMFYKRWEQLMAEPHARETSAQATTRHAEAQIAVVQS